MTWENISSILELILSGAFAWLAWVFMDNRSKIKDLGTDHTTAYEELSHEIQRVELDMSKTYLTKVEFKHFEDKILIRLNQHHTEIASKIDNLDNKLFYLGRYQPVDKP